MQYKAHDPSSNLPLSATSPSNKFVSSCVICGQLSQDDAINKSKNSSVKNSDISLNIPFLLLSSFNEKRLKYQRTKN